MPLASYRWALRLCSSTSPYSTHNEYDLLSSPNREDVEPHHIIQEVTPPRIDDQNL
jgi:hypothetical protein